MSIFVIAEAGTDQQQIPYWLNCAQAASQIVLALGVLASGIWWAMSSKSRRNPDNSAPAHSVNRSSAVGFWIFGLTVLAAAIGWAGLLFGRGDQWASITVLILLSVIIAPISLIILYREIVASLRKFNPRHIVDADYGNPDKGFHFWADTDRSGEMLAEFLRELFKRKEPARLTNQLLGVPDPPGPSHQILRFRLSNGKCFFLHEYGMITIDSANYSPPFSKTTKAKASKDVVPNFPLPFGGNWDELIGEMWTKGDAKKLENGVYELREGGRITTNKTFKTPVAFRLIAKTNSTNIRFAYAADEVIFDWEGLDQKGSDELRIGGGPFGRAEKRPNGKGKIGVDEWVVIDIIARLDSFTIRVNDEKEYRFSENIILSNIGQPFSVFQGFGAVIHVVSLLKADPPN